MNRLIRRIATATSIALALAAPLTVTSAQIGSPNQSRFIVTPYAWFAGLEGEVGVGRVATSVDLSPGDVLDALLFAAAASGEARRGPLVFAADVFYAATGGSKTLAIRGDTGSLSLTQYQTLVQPMVGYGIVRRTWAADLLAGARYWNLTTKLDVQRPRASNERKGTVKWVDALGGVRVRGLAPYHLTYLVGGDAGGGGSQFTWQGYAVAGYRFTSLVGLDVGYRYIDVDYDSDEALFDVRMHGVIAGVSFRW